MIFFAFLLSLIAFFFPFFLSGSSLPILPFIPFVALAILLCPLSKALYLSFAAGLFIDLTSSDSFAIHALNYTLSAAICARYKTRFSAQSPLQLSLYTGFCSFTSTQLHILLLFLFDKKIVFQGQWWVFQWPVLPIFDALYALVWFAGPLALFRITRRVWRRIWIVYWLKKKNPFPN